MSAPIYIQQQVSQMTEEQLQEALDIHKGMLFIIERELIRRVLGQTDDNIQPSQNEDASIELETRQPDNPVSSDITV